MTNPRDRAGTALLVVDVQDGVVATAVDRDGVVGRIASLVEQARAAGTPVVWVLHDDDQLERGSEPWQLVPELSMADGEVVINKSFGDSFEATELDAVLDAADIGRLVVVGAQTDACITSTLHGAVARGYGATLVSDAHTTEDLTAFGAPAPADVMKHLNLMWGMHAVEGRPSGTVTTDAVDFA